MVTKRLGDIRLPYRHFERSEKSLSFAAQWSMCGAPNGKPAIKRPSGIAVIYTLRRFYIFMCRTTISHF